MELSQVESLHAEAPKRGFRASSQIVRGILIGINVRLSPQFGGHEQFFRAFAEELADQFFAATGAIDVGGVEEVDAIVDGGPQDAKGFVLGDVTPAIASQLPTNTCSSATKS